MFFREAKGALCYPGWLNVAGTHPRGFKLGWRGESVKLDSSFGSPPKPRLGGGGIVKQERGNFARPVGVSKSRQCRSNHGARFDPAHSTGIQVIRRQSPSWIMDFRACSLALRQETSGEGKPLEGRSILIKSLSFTYFRYYTMGDLTFSIGDLISDAINKGKPAGCIRMEAVAWCQGNIISDSSAMQVVVKRFLKETINSRLICLDKSSLVQAVDINAIVPRSRPPSSCICWSRRIPECGLCEFSAKDMAVIAGVHYEAAKTPGGNLRAVGITVQYNARQSEEVLTAVAGLLFKLFKIASGLTGLGVRQRMRFASLELAHHKTMLMEIGAEDTELNKLANVVLLAWKPFLGGACGIPERTLPNRVFVSIPTHQKGSYLMACTEAGNFKDSEVVKNIYWPEEEFPARTASPNLFKAASDEPFIRSLGDHQDSVEEILERTRSQMHLSKRFLKKIGVLQGWIGRLMATLSGNMAHFGPIDRSTGDTGGKKIRCWVKNSGGRLPIRKLGGVAKLTQPHHLVDRMSTVKNAPPVRRKAKQGSLRTLILAARFMDQGEKSLGAPEDSKLGYLNFSDKMTLFNLHLFSGIASEWDRMCGVDGGMTYRMEESRLAAFLDSFNPENPGELEEAAASMMKSKVLEANPDLKPVKLDRLPDVIYPNNGFRAIWEFGSVRKMKDFKAGLRIHLRDKIGSSKTLTVKIEEAAVNGDRVLEILVSLPQSREECITAGHAKQVIMYSNRLQAAPKWMQHFVKTFDKNGRDVPGIYISVTCSKSKDTRMFQEMLFRSFPELAGGQLEEWQMGTKCVLITEQDGSTTKTWRKAFFSRICIPLAMHYAGTGTVALDRRAPETLWLTFEDFAYKQYKPCDLCQSRDGHYAFQKLERQGGTSEDILLCPYKGTCPQCGQGQAAFLYGGHRDECRKVDPVCEDCKVVGLPAEHKPMDPIRCRSFLAKAEEEHLAKRHWQASVNKAFESLLAKAIASKGKDFQPYLASRRAAAWSKAHLNGFYRVHEDLGDFQDQLRAMAPGMNNKLPFKKTGDKPVREQKIGLRSTGGGRSLGLSFGGRPHAGISQRIQGASTESGRGFWGPIGWYGVHGLIICLFRVPGEVEGQGKETSAQKPRAEHRGKRPKATPPTKFSGHVLNMFNKYTCSLSIKTHLKREKNLPPGGRGRFGRAKLLKLLAALPRKRAKGGRFWVRMHRHGSTRRGSGETSLVEPKRELPGRCSVRKDLLGKEGLSSHGGPRRTRALSTETSGAGSNGHGHGGPARGPRNQSYTIRQGDSMPRFGPPLVVKKVDSKAITLNKEIPVNKRLQTMIRMLQSVENRVYHNKAAALTAKSLMNAVGTILQEVPALLDAADQHHDGSSYVLFDIGTKIASVRGYRSRGARPSPWGVAFGGSSKSPAHQREGGRNKLTSGHSLIIYILQTPGLWWKERTKKRRQKRADTMVYDLRREGRAPLGLAELIYELRWSFYLYIVAMLSYYMLNTVISHHVPCHKNVREGIVQYIIINVKC